MWLFEKETNDKISLEKYLPSAKMHEYAIPAVLETVFEAEWLRRERFFYSVKERITRMISRWRVWKWIARIAHDARQGLEKKDKSLTGG